MKTTLLFASLLSLASLTAFAAGGKPAQNQPRTLGSVSVTPPKPISGQRAIHLLALETDLTPGQVKTLMSRSPEQNYQYLSTAKMESQFQRALGNERYDALIDGRPIPLRSDKVREAVRAMAASTTPQADANVQVMVAGR